MQCGPTACEQDVLGGEGGGGRGGGLGSADDTVGGPKSMRTVPDLCDTA
jgi:hypothetical protein